MITDINSEDRLVQATFADYLQNTLGWESVYAYNAETFGPGGLLGRANEREVVLVRDLRAAIARLNPAIPEAAREDAVQKLIQVDYSRSKKYMEIIADYNREKDRATVEETFAKLVKFAEGLDEEQKRAAEEGLNEDELALFDLLFKESISKADRERLKQAAVRCWPR
jgi:type I restriction enzyme R subunit